MAKKTVLIVEDEEDIQQLVSYNLIKNGFLVEYAENGEEALDKVRRQPPDLVLLDIMLPGMDGLEVCRRLRGAEQTAEIPIVMLTARGEESDMVAGLDLGADDYVPKPFSPKVLVSRLKAVLRRKVRESREEDRQRGEVLARQDLVIDTGRHQVTVCGRPVDLTPTEFGILSLLVRRPGWVFSRQQIIDAVRGYDYMITPRAVDVQIFSLRKKLGDQGGFIETVRGIGYRFRESG